MNEKTFAGLPWLLVDEGGLEGEIVALDDDETRHLKGALRRRVGDSIVLTDGCGSVCEAVFVSLRGKRALCEPRRIQYHTRPAGEHVTVALGVLHGRAMDWAVQKAVEVGAHRFMPVVCARSQLDPRAAIARRPHWLRVARQALKQCRRPWAMEVAEPCDLQSLLSRSGPGMVASADGLPLEAVPEATVSCLMVGPEGGFSDYEAESIDSSGWVRLRLGPHILRSETAVVLGTGALIVRNETGRSRVGDRKE